MLRRFFADVVPLDKLLLAPDCPYMGFGVDEWGRRVVVPSGACTSRGLIQPVTIMIVMKTTMTTTIAMTMATMTANDYGYDGDDGNDDDDDEETPISPKTD